MPVADRAEADNDLLIRAVVAEGVDDLARDPTVTAQAFRAARGLVRMEPEGVTLESIVRDEGPVVFTLEAGGALTEASRPCSRSSGSTRTSRRPSGATSSTAWMTSA